MASNYGSRSAEGASLRGIGSAINSALAQNELNEHLRPHQALALWPQIAGDQIAGVCTAEAVRGGVLFVRAKSSVWANELTFYKPDLLTRLNERLGGRIIQDIHFSTGRPTSRQRTTAQAAPPNTELRDLSRVAPPTPPAAALDPQVRLDSLVARTRTVLAWKRDNGWIPCSRCSALYEPSDSSSGKTLGVKAASRSKGRSKQAGKSFDGICPVCRTLMQR